MDPDLDYPNNHVPPVASDDDWGDLDEVHATPVPGLPHVRSDHGIPPRKKAKKPVVNHHEAKLKKEDVVSLGEQENSPAAPEETAAGGAASETESTDDEVGSAGSIVLPVSHSQSSGKRHRVNVIGNLGEAGTEHAASMYPVSGAEGEQKAILAAAKPRTLFSRAWKGEWGEWGEWGDERTGGSFRWMVYTGVGVIALVVVTVVLNRRSAGENTREQSMFSKMIPDEIHKDILDEDGAMIALLTDGQDEAKRIFAKYATAGASADFIGSIHLAEEMAGLIERGWEPLGAKPGWHPDGQAVWTVLDQEGVRYGVLEGSLPDFSSYRAFFRQEEEGLKMDWKATTGYGSSDFGMLEKGQGDGGEMRVWLSPADFYTFPLPESEFRSFRLTSPDRQENLWGYTKRGGELDGKLIAQFIPSQITGEAQTEVAVVLGLGRGPAELLPNQWMITKLVRLGWLDE